MPRGHVGVQVPGKAILTPDTVMIDLAAGVATPRVESSPFPGANASVIAAGINIVFVRLVGKFPDRGIQRLGGLGDVAPGVL